MDMDGTTTTSTMADGMTPFLHFTRGDYLLFEAWKPASAGATAGACIGLICLAILDRWLAATRGALNFYWRRKGLASSLAERSTDSPPTEESEKSLSVKEDDSQVSNQSAKHIAHLRFPLTRTVPPFLLAHDIPRGFIHGLQALLTYALMLSAMTFNAAYIISIIAGLGIGEVIFGRMGYARAH